MTVTPQASRSGHLVSIGRYKTSRWRKQQAHPAPTRPDIEAWRGRPGTRASSYSWGMKLYEGDPHRVASLLPGRGYTPNYPLLHFTRRILTDRGWTVRELWWSRGMAMTVPEALVEANAFVREVDTPGLHLVVGKSLGALAAPTAVDLALPAVWLAPLLREDHVRAAVDRTLEPTLLVGGSADPTWSKEIASATRCQVHEVRGGDHALEIPGSVRDSLKALESVMRRVEDFIAGLEA